MKDSRFPFIAGEKAGKLFALFAGALFAYAVFEIGLRIWGLAYEGGQEARNAASANSGKYRIMCLGESTTAGYSWPARLEGELARRFPGAGFSVINKARGGVNSTDLMADLDRNLEEVGPVLVIAMMGINDGFVKYYEGVEDAGGELFKRSRLYRLARLLAREQKVQRKSDGQPRATRRRPDPYAYYRDGTRSVQREEAEFRRRLKRDPEDEEAAYILGRFLSLGGVRGEETEKKASGEKLLLRALELDPGNSFACAALAEYYARLPDPGRAVPMMERALKIDRSAENLYLLGKLYREVGRAADAGAMLEEAVKDELAAGACGPAVLELCSLRVLGGDLSAAERLLRRASAVCPGDEKLAGALEVVYGGGGRQAQAREQAERVAAARSMFTKSTRDNYAELRRKLAERGIALAVMQYPMCDPEPLKWLFDDPAGVLFVDNYSSFQGAVARDGYGRYFMDMFAGNFGHCTTHGNGLIAANAADALAPFLGGLLEKGPQAR